jgi:hypothetical protein
MLSQYLSGDKRELEFLPHSGNVIHILACFVFLQSLYYPALREL